MLCAKRSIPARVEEKLEQLNHLFFEVGAHGYHLLTGTDVWLARASEVQKMPENASTAPWSTKVTETRSAGAASGRLVK